jgi:hypothetical protein
MNSYNTRKPESKSKRYRNGNALVCAVCGKAIEPERGSRRQKYCNDACKFKAFRSKKWVDRYQILDPQRSVENTTAESISCKIHFGGRAFPTKAPLNLLGGYSWPNAAPVDPKLLARIIRSEVGDRIVKPPQPTTTAIEAPAPAPDRQTPFADAVGLHHQGGRP